MAKLAGANVFVHPRNLGKGAAIKAAFSYASESDYDILVFIDGDGQHNPDEIPKLVAPILAGVADVVIGSRYLNGNGENTPCFCRLGQWLLDTAINVNTGLHLTDTQSGFRAFSVHTESAFRFQADTHSIESEMLLDAAQNGLRITEVGIGVRYDVGRHKSRLVEHGSHVLATVLRDMGARKPFYYFALPGLALLCIVVIVGCGLLTRFLTVRHYSLDRRLR